MAPAETDRPISLLVVDDEELLARSCLQILANEGYRATSEWRGRSALEAVRRQHPDIVLADLKLPDMDGIELLREIRKISPDTLVIMITGFATVDSSVEAIEAGAYDYIPKPFTATQLRILIGRAAQQVQLARDNAALRDRLRRREADGGLIGSSDEMRKVLSVVERVARTEANVFVSGESGTGKELVARALHARSRRSEKPFVAINCAALPDQLLESELFGYEKGAFTGADGKRQGLLETATGGTFFLDEVTEMSLELQAKMLRVVQERRIRRVGGSVEIPIDVRWVSSTNRDPDEAVRNGLLRKDLFFRLNVVPVRLPPLRARRDDVPALAQEFLRHFAAEYDRSELKLTPAVIQALRAYSWPGNVRELQNLIERLVSLTAGAEITLEDLPDELLEEEQTSGAPRSNGHIAEQPFHEAKAEAIATFEKAYLHALLRRHQGNISQAAREARIDRKTIHRMLSKYDSEEVGT
ncbi:MAG: sigma-54 dependent transcriptional regulator [Gemmatimonadota bacterium]